MGHKCWQKVYNNLGFIDLFHKSSFQWKSTPLLPTPEEYLINCSFEDLIMCD